MATKNGNGKAAATAVIERPRQAQIPKRIRRIINEAFHDAERVRSSMYPAQQDEVIAKTHDEKKALLALINGLLKNQKPAV